MKNISLQAIQIEKIWQKVTTKFVFIFVYKTKIIAMGILLTLIILAGFLAVYLLFIEVKGITIPLESKKLDVEAINEIKNWQQKRVSEKEKLDL